MAKFTGSVVFQCPECRARAEREVEVIAATRQNAYAEAISGAVCPACGCRPAVCVAMNVDLIENPTESGNP